MKIINLTDVKKKKISLASFNSDVAEGVVDIDKLSGNMETEVDKLKQEFRCSITTRISPGIMIFQSDLLCVHDRQSQFLCNNKTPDISSSHPKKSLVV